jgi:spermidine dehydrogenase
MPDRPTISRRDFLNGVALSVAAGSSLSPLELLAKEGHAPYPPGLTGLRGSHTGSFEVAHAVSLAGATFPRPREKTDGLYDLVVVGGGLSGLSAAYFYRQKIGPGGKILVLDNHDDFGGHAKRNEFDVDGKKLIGYGGSQSIDTPGHYSDVAKQLLVDVGIHTERFYDYFDRGFTKENELGRGFYFSEQGYGRDVTLPGFGRNVASSDPNVLAKSIDKYPLSDADKAGLIALLKSDKNFLPDLDREQKIAWLRRTSYRDFLLKTVGAPVEAYLLFRDSFRGFWGVGWDALSALEAYRFGMPGTRHLGIGELQGEPPGRDEPYIFHFPDGNAGVARSLVRALLPEAVPGKSMEDLVLSRVDYDLLDRLGSNCRIRLNSTAVDVRHTTDEKHVDVTYVSHGDTYRVRGKHVVMACYNDIIPSICPELPADQREAIAYATKVPLVYLNIAVRNWRPLAEMEFSSISIPKPELMHSFGLDFPVSMGGYDFTNNPDQPAVLHGTFVPTAPDQGLSSRQQHKLGRRALYEMSWDELEGKTLDQLQGAMGAAGFDAGRDIAGLTINRWPHGYAYEYNELWDPPEYNRDNGPHILGARQLGRISIANSDAAAYAYVNGAVDTADRAVNEQTV